MAFWWIILLIIATIITFLGLYMKAQFYPSKTDKIPVQSDSVEIMVIKEGNVNCYVIKNSTYTIFIDSGLGKQTPRELQKLGIKPEDVTHVFLTHSDYDHVGGLKYFGQAQIYFGSLEKPLLTGDQKRFLGIFKNEPLNRDYKLLEDHDKLTIGDISIESLHTPGHTLGHTCYVVNQRYVFTGDLLRIKKDAIHPFFPFINMSTQQCRESITKLVEIIRNYPMELICTGHTGYSNNVQTLIQSWL